MMKSPASTEEKRRFLLALNFYQRFILCCSGNAEPLFWLIQGLTLFLWGPKQKTEFTLLIQALSTAPLLQFPD